MPGGAALPAAVLRHRAVGERPLRPHVRLRGDPRTHADAACRVAAARPAAHRLPFRRPARSRDGQDDVAGDRRARPRPVRALLLLGVARARRLDRAKFAARRQSASRRSPRSTTRRPRCDRGGRPRHPGRPVDAHARRAARHPRAEARARADHARRERRHRRPRGGGLEAHRRVRGRAREPGVPDRADARDGRLRVSVPARGAGGAASVRPAGAAASRRTRS